jgi:methylmalonyl-CoA mutase cobalamin-binding subunit
MDCKMGQDGHDRGARVIYYWMMQRRWFDVDIGLYFKLQQKLLNRR